MKTCIVVKEFSVPTIDEWGYTIEEEYITVAVDSLWEIKENNEYEVYLEDEEGNWLGMGKEKFEECFEHKDSD